MSLFEETFQEMESFGNEFDTTVDKIRILTEYVVADYQVDIKTALLSAKQNEDVTMEAVSEAFQIAYEKCADKIKKSIGGINRNSQDYFAKINASLTKIIEDPSYQKIIDDASALCKEYPKLGSVEVTYDGYQEELKAVTGAMDSLQKIIVKGKASKIFTEETSKKIDEIVTEVNKKRQALGKQKVTVKLVEAISLLSTLMIALKNQTEEKSMEGIGVSPDGMEPESMRIFVKAVANQMQLAKTAAAINTRTVLSLRNGIKKATKQKKAIEKEEKKEAKAAEKEMKEFVDDDFEEESFNASELLESVFEALHEQANPSVEEEEVPVEESVEDLEADIQNSLTYMQQLEDEVLGIHTESADYVDSPVNTRVDEILTQAAEAAAEPLNSNPEEKIPEVEAAKKEIEKAVKESEEESIPVPEETPEVEEEPVQESTLDDSDLDFDADSILEQIAQESGIEPETEEEDSLDALLESFNQEFGVDLDKMDEEE